MDTETRLAIDDPHFDSRFIHLIFSDRAGNCSIRQGVQQEQPNYDLVHLFA